MNRWFVFIAMLITFYIAGYTSESQRHGELVNQLKNMKPQDVNEYKNDRPQEANYMEQGENLEHAASQKTTIDPHAQLLLETAHKRPFFALDPHQDPIITQGDEAVKNIEETIRTATEYQYVEPQYTEHLCEESKPTFQVDCTKTLNVAVLTRKQKIYLYSVYNDTQHNKISNRIDNTPSAQEFNRYWHEDGNWHHHGRRHIYRYEIQHVDVDTQQGTSNAKAWTVVTQDVWNKTPDDTLHDEWIDSCAYLKPSKNKEIKL